ncbi:TetR/AcrR family transcriptional regulator [Streptomyces sp. NPDC049687]|uniref:TetR/AcrR family transcriptional regulator n=1 Tax=Streptomyces sp. NPDC049687 TaxID=3365596 RepID=UPI0037AF3E03
MTTGPSEEPAPHRVRRDVQRNLDTLLTAAADVFAAEGVDAPVRRITEKAGVGSGTLYRHFPQRSDLIVAVFRREIDACVDAATALSAQYEPLEALTLWLGCLAEFFATKRGFKTALHSGDPAYENLPAYFMERFGPVVEGLLTAADASGDIRADITPYDLLRTMANLVDPEDSAYTRHMITLIVNGLRYRSGS